MAGAGEAEGLTSSGRSEETRGSGASLGGSSGNAGPLLVDLRLEISRLRTERAEAVKAAREWAEARGDHYSRLIERMERFLTRLLDAADGKEERACVSAEKRQAKRLDTSIKILTLLGRTVQVLAGLAVAYYCFRRGIDPSAIIGALAP